MLTPRMKDKNTHGQALVEMALVLFLLLLLVIGIFEFGRAMYIKNTLTHAARAGARAAVVTPGITGVNKVKPDLNCNYGDNPTGNDRVYQAVCNSLYSGIEKKDVEMNIDIKDLAKPDGLSPGDMIEVGVKLTKFSSFFKPISNVLPNALEGKTAMRYE